MVVCVAVCGCVCVCVCFCDLYMRFLEHVLCLFYDRMSAASSRSKICFTASQKENRQEKAADQKCSRSGLPHQAFDRSFLTCIIGLADVSRRPLPSGLEVSDIL